MNMVFKNKLLSLYLPKKILKCHNILFIIYKIYGLIAYPMLFRIFFKMSVYMKDKNGNTH